MSFYQPWDWARVILLDKTLIVVQVSCGGKMLSWRDEIANLLPSAPRVKRYTAKSRILAGPELNSQPCDVDPHKDSQPKDRQYFAI